jgi:hypothetical protein
MLVLLGLKVGDSPVVPTATMPCEPSSISQSMRRRKPCSSSEPLRIGVMMAGMDPLKVMGRTSLNTS